MSVVARTDVAPAGSGRSAGSVADEAGGGNRPGDHVARSITSRACIQWPFGWQSRASIPSADRQGDGGNLQEANHDLPRDQFRPRDEEADNDRGDHADQDGSRGDHRPISNRPVSLIPVFGAGRPRTSAAAGEPRYLGRWSRQETLRLRCKNQGNGRATRFCNHAVLERGALPRAVP